MKIKYLMIGMLVTVFLSACGGEDEESEKEKAITVCECVELGEKMYEEMKEIDMTADDAEDKMKETEDKYKSDIEACEEKFKDMSNEDAEKAVEDCK